MAKNLEPTPDEKPANRDSSSDLGTILEHLPREKASDGGSRLADLSTYDMLMEDAPVKLDEAQAGFVRGGGGEDGSCGACYHYYVSTAADRKVCEIFRPSDESNIDGNDRCRFFTVDGETFPFLPKPKKSKQKTGEATA